MEMANSTAKESANPFGKFLDTQNQSGYESSVKREEAVAAKVFGPIAYRRQERHRCFRARVQWLKKLPQYLSICQSVKCCVIMT